MIQTSNRAALYARFSSDNQRSESIDAQIRAMKAYCAQRHIAIVETYIDEAKSATTDRRPSFQQMIADSSSHTFNILLVHKLDRFARNRYDSAVYKRELRKNGVTVYSVLENLDNSPESVMMESVLEGMSEYYSQNLAREVMKGMRETALQCKHTGGKPPLGYVSRKLVINPQEAEAVRLIFSMYGEGCGYSEVLAALHEAGYKTKNGKEFMKNSLYSILTNPKNSGIYVFNRSSAKTITGTRNTHLLKDNEEIISIEGGVPQIVDERTFTQVQRRIDSNKRIGLRNKAKTVYLLAGKVVCNVCGRSMTGNTRYSDRNKDKYVTYRCPSKHFICNNKEISQEYLDRFVVAMLEIHIFNDAAIQRIAKRIEAMSGSHSEIIAGEGDKLQASLDEVDEAINNIWSHVDDKRLVDVVLIQCYSGWRPQELGLLELENVDLKNWTFQGGMKTNAGMNRVVLIHSRIRHLVERKYQEAVRLGSRFLFNCTDGRNGKPTMLAYTRYQKGFAMIRDEIKLNPEHRPHDGRKHFVTMAKKAGVDEYAIKYMVGHMISDITEKVYTQREFEWLKDEIEKIK